VTIRVFVVDDHPIVQQGVSNVFEDDSDIMLVGAAETLGTAVSSVRALRPDVILLDVRLGDGKVACAVTALRRVSSSSQIVLFTAHPAHAGIREALKAGAIATLPKEIAPIQLREAVKAAFAGSLQRGVVEPDRLTPRQREVLEGVASGMTNIEIADQLRLQPATVKAYWQEAMQRLGVRNRAEAIATAYRLDLL
jgi:DNA-binding NarL/FixJ family response regulator